MVASTRNLERNSKPQKAAVGRNGTISLTSIACLHPVPTTGCIHWMSVGCDPETNFGYRAGQNEKITSLKEEAMLKVHWFVANHILAEDVSSVF